MNYLSRISAMLALTAAAVLSSKPNPQLITNQLRSNVRSAVQAVLDGNGDAAWRIPTKIETDGQSTVLTFEKYLTPNEADLLRRDPRSFAWEQFLNGAEGASMYVIDSVDATQERKPDGITTIKIQTTRMQDSP